MPSGLLQPVKPVSAGGINIAALSSSKQFRIHDVTVEYSAFTMNRW